MTRIALGFLVAGAGCIAIPTGAAAAESDATGKPAMTYEAFQRMIAERAAETRQRLEASPLHQFRTDYFVRFNRDPEAAPAPDEVAVESGWRIRHSPDASPVVGRMAGHLAEFFERCMKVAVPVEAGAEDAAGPALLLYESGGGDPAVPESFTLSVAPGRIEVRGVDPGGLRSGVVRLIGLMGLRQAPFLTQGETVYTPRVPVRRSGMGSVQDAVFYGCNAVLVGGAELYALSTSEAIPELKARRVPGALDTIAAAAEEARAYGLKKYVHLSTAQKFAKEDPIFTAHPDIRGALTWKADGDYTLCTEHPLVRQYLAESVEGLFRRVPDLDGITVIIGGEGFYHCFMRAYGVGPGHTNCARCEALGAETVVANLCNTLAEAARRVNPEAQVIAWPYSASYVWSADWAQVELMKKLKPGVAILTEMAKDEVLDKPGGVRKHLWDYTIDLIGPGNRARTQLAASRETGVPVHVLSMAEMSFEAPLLPLVPCLDRWAARAEAMASCGAQGTYVWEMAPFDGASSAEVYQYSWYAPAPDTEWLLRKLADRIAGNPKAGEGLRTAWREVSRAIPHIPAVGEYYRGPHYLGPANPLTLDPDAEIPDLFKGYYLFLMEMTRDSAMEPLPTFRTKPEDMVGYTGPESVAIFEVHYRTVEEYLERAVAAVDAAEQYVPERARLTFQAETLPIRWFYHTARTQANVYEVFRLRKPLLEWAEAGKPLEPAQAETAKRSLARLREILEDEKANAEQALPIAEADPRLETYHRGDHSLNRLVDMMHAKIEFTDRQLKEDLPKLAERLGIEL